jgi:hypothetical protein
MSLSREDMYLLWEDTGVAKEDETDYFVLGVPKTSMKPFLDTLAGANIKPYIMDVKPLALARTLSLKEGIIVSLERSFFDIVVVFEGMVRVMHSVSPMSKPEALSGLINELIDGLNMAVKSFNRDYPQNALSADTPIYLAGGLAANADMTQMIQESTGHPVTIVKPPLELPPDMSPELYSAAIGLIFKKLSSMVDKSQYHDIDINLLLKTQKPKQLGQQIAAGVSVVFILLLAALVYEAYNMKNQALANVDELTQQNVKATQLLATTQKSLADAEAARKAANDKVRPLPMS